MSLLLSQRTRISIRKLAKRVRKLAKAVTNQERFTFSNNYGIGGFTTGITAQNVPLFNFPSWFPIFGSDTQTSNRCRINSVTIRGRITPGNESTVISGTLFLASPRDDANDAFNPTSGGYTLTADLDYAQTGTQTPNYTYLNPKRWKVYYVKRWRTGLTADGSTLSSDIVPREDVYNVVANVVTPPRTQAIYRYEHVSGSRDGCVWFKKKVKLGWMIENKSTAQYGSWRSMTCPKDPSKNLYLIWVANNSVADGASPQIQMVADYRVTTYPIN